MVLGDRAFSLLPAGGAKEAPEGPFSGNKTRTENNAPKLAFDDGFRENGGVRSGGVASGLLGKAGVKPADPEG